MKQVGKFNSKDWGTVLVLAGNYIGPDGPLYSKTANRWRRSR